MRDYEKICYELAKAIKWLSTNDRLSVEDIIDLFDENPVDPAFYDRCDEAKGRKMTPEEIIEWEKRNQGGESNE